MFIIAGRFAHRKIVTPKSDQIRPTQGSLRGAVFNILQNSIEGTTFLDLCAGSGAMGLEALSRGASRATFVDSDKNSCAAIRQNIEAFSLQNEAELIYKDGLIALKMLEKRGQLFDICYVDPPYQKSKLLASLLETLDSKPLVKEGGLVIVETDDDRLDTQLNFKKLTLESKRHSGDSILYIFRSK